MRRRPEHAGGYALPSVPARGPARGGARSRQGGGGWPPRGRGRRPGVEQAGGGQRQAARGRLGHGGGAPARGADADPGDARGPARPAGRRAGGGGRRDRARLLPQARAQAARGLRGGAAGPDGAGDRQPLPLAASLPRPPQQPRAGGGDRRDGRRRPRRGRRAGGRGHHRDRRSRVPPAAPRGARCGLSGEAARPLLTPVRVRELLAGHGLRPTKALGQNYLVDPNTARKVVRLAGVEPGETVLEIGPGLGSLTLALRQAGARVVAVEADERLLPALAEALGDDPGVRVVAGDALRLDLAGLAPEASKLVANLPYNLAATIVLEVLTSFPGYQRLTVMVQREVGERLAATPGTSAYGATSVKVAALAEARLLAPVGRKVFLPEPHVDSVLVGLRRRRHPATDGVPWRALDRVIEAAFSQRRKTLRNSLRTLGLDQDGVEALGRAAQIDLGLRAERLDVAAFAALAAALQGAPQPLEP